MGLDDCMGGDMIREAECRECFLVRACMVYGMFLCFDMCRLELVAYGMAWNGTVSWFILSSCFSNYYYKYLI